MVEWWVAIVVAAITAVVGGFVGGWAKPWAEHRYEVERARRQDRKESLDRLHDAMLARRAPDSHLQVLASTVGDPTLHAAVGRFIAAADEATRNEARGDVSHRVGELLRDL